MKNPTIRVTRIIIDKDKDEIMVRYVITIPHEDGVTELSGITKVGEEIDLELTTNED